MNCEYSALTFIGLRITEEQAAPKQKIRVCGLKAKSGNEIFDVSDCAFSNLIMENPASAQQFKFCPFCGMNPYVTKEGFVESLKIDISDNDYVCSQIGNTNCELKIITVHNSDTGEYSYYAAIFVLEISGSNDVMFAYNKQVLTYLNKQVAEYVYNCAGLWDESSFGLHNVLVEKC